MKCCAKDCNNEVGDEHNACDACLGVLDDALKAELSVRLGRPATDEDVTDLLEQILSRRPN